MALLVIDANTSSASEDNNHARSRPQAITAVAAATASLADGVDRHNHYQLMARVRLTNASVSSTSTWCATNWFDSRRPRASNRRRNISVIGELMRRKSGKQASKLFISVAAIPHDHKLCKRYTQGAQPCDATVFVCGVRVRTRRVRVYRNKIAAIIITNASIHTKATQEASEHNKTNQISI